MENINIDLLAAEIDAVAEFLTTLANESSSEELAWDQSELKPKIDKIWNSMFGGWRGFNA